MCVIKHILTVVALLYVYSVSSIYKITTEF